MLAFGWLFIAPLNANSDDPISIAQQEIQDLKNSINDLNYKKDFSDLINIAENKYNDAVTAKNNKDTAITEYDNAVTAETNALTEKNTAQTAVDNQTKVIAAKLKDKNDAKDALDIAIVNLTNAQNAMNSASNQGVSFQIYPLSRAWDGSAYIAEGAGLMCQGSISSLNVWAGWGSICGLHDNIIGIFTTTLTIPEGINSVKFAGYTDDGFRLYVDGVLETSQWQEQGSTWSPYTRWFDTSVDKTLQLQAWWYNGGGPGNMHVGWGHSGIWTGIPAEYLSYGSGPTQEQVDAYNAALTNKTSAQENYDTKLSEYNTSNNILTTYNQTLNSKLTAYNNAKTNTENKLIEKNNAENIYNQSIIDMNTAINNAWDYYNIQKEKELQIAIAQALANQPQPQPTPEPTIVEPEPSPETSVEPSSEPTPEPSPEQTKPIDPTPEPSSDTTDEATPTPTPTPEPSIEPSVEPSPQPTDTNPSPESEPSADPVVIPDKTDNSPIDAQTANLIADLTNSNTLTKLTPEQKAVVAQTLGIKTEEIAKVAELAKSDPVITTALQEFGNRANENINAPMPYTLADATTEIQTEAFLADPLGAVLNINPAELLSNFSELGSDMTDDQREKAQEVIIPVVLVSNIVSAVIGMRR